MVRRFKVSVLFALVFVLLVSVGTVSAAPNESGRIHIVCRGETLSGIAARYGVSMWAIARANGIANPNRIYAGQRLVIPSYSGGTTWGGWSGGVHTVRRGETLSGIASRYGVNMWSLARANGIANPNCIYAGQRLVISTGGYAHAPAGGGVHVVRRGETLGHIAYRYGVTVWSIANANGIANPNVIYAGQRLVIPSA